jgi:hypothetical protein
MVLTLVTAGIVSAAALPKNVTVTTKPNAAPIPLCDPWASPDCH